MNLKQLLTNGIIGIFLLFSTPAYAFALTTAVPAQNMKYEVGNGIPVINGSASANPTFRQVLTGTLQQRAATEIQRRITALNRILPRVSRLKHLSYTQKSTFATGIQTEIASLTALGTKIQADTDTATLKADVRSVIASYRIYALFLPQVRLLVAADTVLDISDKMSSLSGSIQTRITQSQEAGQNVIPLQTLLTNIQSKITDAKSQANSIITTVTPLTPADYPGNITTLLSARAQLQNAISDLKIAETDARQIILELLTMGNLPIKTSTASSSINTVPPAKTQEAPASSSGK